MYGVLKLLRRAPSVAVYPNVKVRRKQRGWRLAGLIPILAYLLVVFVFPVVSLLILSFQSESGSFSLSTYGSIFSSTLYIKVLFITVDISFWTTVFCLLGGYPIAYLLARSPRDWKNLLAIAVLMPFWTGFLIRTFAWIVLLGRHGAINNALMASGIVTSPVHLIYNFSGVMIGMVQALMPLAILTMMPVMERIDDNYVKAASTLGANPEHAFWRVYFPLSFQGVAAAGLLVFITSLGFFITPALLGGAKQTMIAQVIITQIQQMLDWKLAGAVSMLLLVTVLGAFVVYERVMGMTTLTGDAAGSKMRHNWGILRWTGVWLGRLVIEVVSYANSLLGQAIRVGLGTLFRFKRRGGISIGRPTLWVFTVLILAFLVLPAFFVVPVSFTSQSFLSFPPRGFSLKWYEAYLHSPIWITATLRSIGVALVTGVIAVVLGSLAAFVMARQRFVGKTGVLALILSPLILPRIVTAVALFYVFARIHLVGTSIGLVLGHTVLALPYVVITVMAVLRTYDSRLDDAASTLGASKWQAIRHITLPIIKTGLIAAFVFAFITSFDELTIALFVSGGMATTLPKQMWTSVILQVNPTLAAVASIMLGVITTILFGAELVRRLSTRR